MTVKFKLRFEGEALRDAIHEALPRALEDAAADAARAVTLGEGEESSRFRGPVQGMAAEAVSTGDLEYTVMASPPRGGATQEPLQTLGGGETGFGRAAVPGARVQTMRIQEISPEGRKTGRKLSVAYLRRVIWGDVANAAFDRFQANFLSWTKLFFSMAAGKGGSK